MPRRPSATRRLGTAALWPFGIGLTSWNYMWRITPLHRREVPGSEREDVAPELPVSLDLDEVLHARDGVGPLFHRRYRTRIRESELTAEEVVGRVRRDLNSFAPTAFASFHKVRGAAEEMLVGDEYVVRMPGPWDGPVRVVEVTDRSFRFVTLAGHLEAGQIEFRAERDTMLVFTIESWARSADWLSNLLYHRLRMAKEVQLHMWISFLERIVRLSGGRMTGGIDIHTRRVDEVRGGG